MTDPVEEFLDELECLDNTHDPTVAIFDEHPDRAVVAKVGRSYRMLSSGLLFPREIDVSDVREIWDQHGEPRKVALSTQSNRFHARHFTQEVPDLD